VLSSCKKIIIEDGSVVDITTKMRVQLNKSLKLLESLQYICIAMQIKKENINEITKITEEKDTKDIVFEECKYSSYENNIYNE